MNTIGENIAYFRKQKKLTQEELAEKMSVTAQAVSKWECDSSYPDITVMQALSKILGVTVDELVNGVQEIPELKEAEPEKIDRRIVLIEVKAGETNITTRFPVATIRKAMANGTLEKLMGDGAVQVDMIADMIDAGVTGPITEVDDPNVHVVIRVVDYED